MAIAITSLTSMATGNKTSEASTTTPAVGSPVPAAGDLVLVYISADNAGTSGAEAISSVTDSAGGNTYSEVVLQNQTSGAANDGLTVAIYGSALTTGWTTSTTTVTVNWSPNVTAKVIQIHFVTGANTTAYATGTNSGSGSTYTSNATTSMASGDLVVVTVGNESNTGPAADTDTTNGSWSTNVNSSGGSGGDGTKMAQRIHRKIVTGAGTQECNAATGASTDWAVAYALYTVPAAARVPHSTPYPQLLAH